MGNPLEPNSPLTSTIDESTPQPVKPSRPYLMWLLIPLGAAVFIGLVVAIIVFRGGGSGGQLNVKTWLDTGGVVTSGSETLFKVSYENSERQDLTNVSLEIVYPEGFRFISSQPDSKDGVGREFNLEDLKSGGSNTVEIRGIFSGSPQEIKVIQAKLFFQIRNSTASFNSSASAEISLQAPNLNLQIAVPSQHINAQKIDYLISFANISDEDLNRVQIRVTYPKDFVFSDSSLASDDNQTWAIGQVLRGQQQQLRITGFLSGTAGDEKELVADLGYVDSNGQFVSQNRQTATTRITDPPLAINHTPLDLPPSGTITEGEVVSYQLIYENRGTQGMHNVQIYVELSTDVLDLATLRASGAALVGTKLIWKASGQPALSLLQPGASGKLQFSSKIKNNLSAQRIKNPKLVTTAYVSSEELPQPIPGNRQEVKVRSTLNASAEMVRVSGPAPLEPGVETMYKVTLNVSSSFNALSGIIWQSAIDAPPFELVMDSITPVERAKDVTFNSNSGMFVWKVGNLSEYSNAVLEFNLKVVPSEPDRGSELRAFKIKDISGQDSFTSESLLPLVGVRDLLTEKVADTSSQ